MSETSKAINRFQKQIDQTLDYYSELLLAVSGKTRQAALETILAEQCAMSLAVSWEAFIHDVLIAHVVMNSSVFISSLQARLKQSIAEKYGSAVGWTKFKFPKSPNKDQLMGMVDPKGWNITANSAEELASRANSLLQASDAKKFSLDAEDRAFVDYLISIRNYLGHRSKGSRSEVGRTIRGMQATPRNSELVAPIQTVGAYLKNRVSPDRTRAQFIGSSLREISEKLR
ncbi:MAG: hypothetical protein WCE53_16190 [Candidatus Acidiferrum sp.]